MKQHIDCLFVLPIILTIVFVISCSKLDSQLSPVAQDTLPDLSLFERSFAERICSLSTKGGLQERGVTLTGFKTLEYHGEDSVFVSNLWTQHRKEINAMDGVYAYNGRVRIYFPLANALVRLNGRLYVADHNGFIKDFPRDSVAYMQLSGRAETKHTRYTAFKGNYQITSLIEDYSTVIYDLGIRNSCNRKSQDMVEALRDEENEGISCIENHGGHNCTYTFDLYQGRCPINYNRCMDYNGPGTNCKGSKLFFVGSDCCISLALGNCWHEVMK